MADMRVGEFTWGLISGLFVRLLRAFWLVVFLVMVGFLLWGVLFGPPPPAAYVIIGCSLGTVWLIRSRR
jgi:hypothetical protein